MLSHNIASKQTNKDEDQSKGGSGNNGRNTSSLRPPEQIIKCPRCDSPNTKFCYYNNYSLAQPRHFCKACRRYWTKGGALRNVPIGGSTCRKNRKTKTSSSKYCPSSDIGGMKFFGLSTLDFQLGGLNFPSRVSNQFSSSYGDTSSNHPIVNLNPLGYNLPLSSSSSSHILMKQQHNQNGGHLGSLDLHNTSIASSIESLSSINQDLHLKLQQQRLSMFQNDHQPQQKQQVVLEPQHQKLQPILFQNLETSKQAQSFMDGGSRKETADGCDVATEWFFDGGAAGNDENGNMNNWNRIQSWNQLNEYS